MLLTTDLPDPPSRPSKMVIPGNYEVSTFTLVHHNFLIKCWGLEIDRNQRHSFAGCYFELLKTKVNERHLARVCIATQLKLFTRSPRGQAYQAITLPNPMSLHFGLKPINCLRRDNFGCKSIPSCNCPGEERKFQSILSCIWTVTLKGVGSGTPVTSSLRQVPILVSSDLSYWRLIKIRLFICLNFLSPGSNLIGLLRSVRFMCSPSPCHALTACQHHVLLKIVVLHFISQWKK